MGRRGRNAQQQQQKKKKKASRSWLSRRSTRTKPALEDGRLTPPLDQRGLSLDPGIPTPGLLSILEKVGYDTEDRHSRELGRMACAAAQTIALAAEVGTSRPARAGAPPPTVMVTPERIPRLDTPTMHADSEGLRALFCDDPELRRVRFDSQAIVAYYKSVYHERPADSGEAQAWIDRIATPFASTRGNRLLLEALPEKLLAAAARWRGQPERLRHLALALVFASAPRGLDSPNPLTVLIFRLSLLRALEESQEHHRLFESLGVDIERSREAMAAGEPAMPADLEKTFSSLPREDREKLVSMAERNIEWLEGQILSDGFSVGLPVPCLFEPLASLAPLVAEAERVEPGSEEAAPLKARFSDRLASAMEKALSPEARRLYGDVCDRWLAREASGDPDLVPIIKSLRAMAASNTLLVVERTLVYRTLATGCYSSLPDAPPTDPWRLMTDPDALEQYGDLLVKTGYPALALQAYRMALSLTPSTPVLETKVAWLSATCDPPQDP